MTSATYSLEVYGWDSGACLTRETLLPTLTLRFQPWGKLEWVAFQEALQSL